MHSQTLFQVEEKKFLITKCTLQKIYMQIVHTFPLVHLDTVSCSLFGFLTVIFCVDGLEE